AKCRTDSHFIRYPRIDVLTDSLLVINPIAPLETIRELTLRLCPKRQHVLFRVVMKIDHARINDIEGIQFRITQEKGAVRRGQCIGFGLAYLPHDLDDAVLDTDGCESITRHGSRDR